MFTGSARENAWLLSNVGRGHEADTVRLVVEYIYDRFHSVLVAGGGAEVLWSCCEETAVSDVRDLMHIRGLKQNTSDSNGKSGVV